MLFSGSAVFRQCCARGVEGCVVPRSQCHAWCPNAHGAVTGGGYSSRVGMRQACPGHSAHPATTQAFFLKEKGWSLCLGCPWPGPRCRGGGEVQNAGGERGCWLEGRGGRRCGVGGQRGAGDTAVGGGSSAERGSAAGGWGGGWGRPHSGSPGAARAANSRGAGWEAGGGGRGRDTHLRLLLHFFFLFPSSFS